MGLAISMGSSSSTAPAANLTNSTAQGIASTNSMLSAATSIGSNYPTQVNLPSWLTTNPDSLQTELASQYQSAPKAITDQANSTAATANAAADENYGQQLRQGSNATTQLINSQRQQGGTAKTSSIVAGQMAEDAQKNRTDARVQIAQMQLGATEQAASLSSQIATSMASLRSSYLGTLAQTNDTLRGQDVSLTQSTAALAAQQAAASRSSGAAAPAAPAAPTEVYYGQRGSGEGVYGGTQPQAGGAGQTIYPGWG